ncbi:MAG: aminopeptidase, partial [Bacteroidetes bacterium]|nr:aminopeptidase [Bacteroidota bacterium]
MKVSVLLLFVLLFSFTLAQNKKQPMTKDVHTFANSDEIAVSHLDLNLTADFTKKILSGKATLTLSHKKKSNTLILDTRDLTIEKVTLDEKETPAKFSLGNEVQYLGRPLTISLTPKTKTVTIYYSTSPNAAALQWLEPSQTAGKKFPYLFTQSEAILARTWVPCQDGPGIRFTYSAVIHTPAELMAVMSAAGNATAK